MYKGYLKRYEVGKRARPFVCKVHSFVLTSFKSRLNRYIFDMFQLSEFMLIWVLIFLYCMITAQQIMAYHHYQWGGNIYNWLTSPLPKLQWNNYDTYLSLVTFSHILTSLWNAHPVISPICGWSILMTPTGSLQSTTVCVQFLRVPTLTS